MVRPWRAIVVDDNPAMLRAASRLLASLPGVEVVAQVASGAAALEAADRERPDLVLIDMSMPGMDGLEATRRLTGRPGAPAVVIMSVHDQAQYREAASASGAAAFVSKPDLVARLAEVVAALGPDRGGIDEAPAG